MTRQRPKRGYAGESMRILIEVNISTFPKKSLSITMTMMWHSESEFMPEFPPMMSGKPHLMNFKRNIMRIS